jgi:hypothetical protein
VTRTDILAKGAVNVRADNGETDTLHVSDHRTTPKKERERGCEVMQLTLVEQVKNWEVGE